MKRNENRKYAYINGTVYTGRLNDAGRMEKLVRPVILTEEGRITAIGDRHTDLFGHEIVDLEGRWMMPGLINLHVHLPASGKPKARPEDPKETVRKIRRIPGGMTMARRICEKAAKTELFSGVTTIRTVGGLDDLDSRIRDRIQRGKLAGPRILAGNMAVSVPGGHMAGSLAYEALSAEDARRFTGMIAESGADLIKLMITGGVLGAEKEGEPGVLRMPPDYVRAACEEAHRRGLPVSAHVESPEGVKTALRNGVDTIEHGAMPDEEMMALFRETGASFVTTISPAVPYALFDRSVSRATRTQQVNGRVVLEGCIALTRACAENGIRMGLGTDTGCPFVTHYGIWRELAHLRNFCGLEPDRILHMATLGNAEIAGIGDLTGSIETGKAADMVITSADPLRDFRALGDPALVVSRGELFDHPKVKRFKVVEEVLDRFMEQGRA